jgi:ABC-type bacteriocin/lantibiotic exporter with double-glycine peptidase domain
MMDKPKDTKDTWRILTDQALGEGRQEFSHDGLSFKGYAQVLADIALSNSPLTIGVFGEWGTGKTSLMRMIEKNFDA